MAQQNINILLTSFPGLGLPPTLPIPVDASTPITDLRERLYNRLPQIESRFILTNNSNREILDSQAPVLSLLSSERDTFLPLRLSVPLCGGKGGFGSQLRAAGGRMSSRRKHNQGDSINSNRNLDGRRLRTVNEAKALAEYLALKPEMEKKEKEVRRKRWVQVVELAERREEEIRNGSKGKVDGKWMEDKEEAGERAREAVLAAIKSGDYHDNLKHSSSGSSAGGSPKYNQGSEHDPMDEPEQSQAETTATTKITPASTRVLLGFDEDDEFVSDDEDEPHRSGDEAVTTSMGNGKAAA